MKTSITRVVTVMVIILALIIKSSFARDYQAASQKESEFSWPDGKRMALSLTFDDARTSQVDIGIPLLDKYDVKGTFYVSPRSMMRRLDGWKQAVSNGHEIGNHSLRHPCSGNHTWSVNNSLEDHYTLERMRVELDSANRLIYDALGVTPVSFAYPCGQTFIGRGVNTQSYIPVVASMFKTGRGWVDEVPNDPVFSDMAQLTGIPLDARSFDEIVKVIESAKRRGAWLILGSHEVGEEGTGDIYTSYINVIEAICEYAKDPANGIWIDNVETIATYITGKRGF
jgi:peptidoglycan-N-acetylglucosamine deacetylase